MSSSIVASLSQDIGQSALLFAIVSGYVTIVLHELGHAAVALRSSATDPVRIEIGRGPRVLRFHVGRAEVCVSAVPSGGRVIWDPPVMRVGTYRRFISAGPWASLAAALAFGLFGWAARQSGAGPTYALCVGLALNNALAGIYNAVPFSWRRGGTTRTSDGYKRRALERLRLPDDGIVWDRTVVAETPAADVPAVAAPVLAEVPPVAATSVAPPGYRAAA